MAMMKRLMIPAASSRLTPGTEYSRAKRDKVMVSRDAIKIMGLVVPAAIVKLIGDTWPAGSVSSRRPAI
jgi:hypothetical protein